MRFDVAKGCTSKKRYMSAGLAAVAAQEFMLIQQEVKQMVAYRCPHCRDWHISKQVRQGSDEKHLVVDQDLNIRFRRDIEANRLKRRLRVKMERQAQGRRKYLGEIENEQRQNGRTLAAHVRRGTGTDMS
jgi:KaiC/GvpD/RAD55 family RecA-like ATPase